MINSLEDLKGLRILSARRINDGDLEIVVGNTNEICPLSETITISSDDGLSISTTHTREVTETRVETIYLD